MGKTRKLTICAVLISLALALSYMERFFPLQLVVPLPGVKLGLANIVSLVALYLLDGKIQGEISFTKEDSQEIREEKIIMWLQKLGW